MKWNILSLKNGEAAAPLYNYPWVFREKPYRIWLICWKYSWLLPTLLFSVNALRDWKSATQISEHFPLLQAMAWPSKCQSMTQTMSCKCEVGIKWRICWGSFLSSSSWSRTCWHIFDVCGLETVIFKHLAKTTWFVSISFTFKDLFPQKENISNVSLKRLLDLVFLYLMGSMYGIFTYTFTIKIN